MLKEIVRGVKNWQLNRTLENRNKINYLKDEELSELYNKTEKFAKKCSTLVDGAVLASIINILGVGGLVVANNLDIRLIPAAALGFGATVAVSNCLNSINRSRIDLVNQVIQSGIGS